MRTTAILLPLQYLAGNMSHHLRASYPLRWLSRCRCLHHHRAHHNHRLSRYTLHHPRMDRRGHPWSLARALHSGPSRRISRLQATFRVYIYVASTSSTTSRYVVANRRPSSYSLTDRSLRLPASRVSASYIDPPVSFTARMPVSNASPSPRYPQYESKKEDFFRRLLFVSY